MIHRARIEQILLILSVVGVLFLMLAGNMKAWRETTRYPSSNSDASAGVSTFAALKNRLQPDAAVSLKRALISPEDLAPFETVALLDPQRPLSAREESILLGWVERGGKLLFSFHGEKSLAAQKPFLERAGIKAFVSDNPGFQDGQSQATVAATDHGFFKAGEEYAFYGRLRFQDDLCFREPPDCYLREAVLGKGGVIAISGLVPFANGLIARSDNKRLAARLALLTGRTAFFDYHLFETQKTISDFLTEPSVLLPCLGMLIGVFLFFFAGGGDDAEARKRAAPPRQVRSFHSLNRELLEVVLGKKGGLQAAALKQANYLRRLIGRHLSAEEQNELNRQLSKLKAAPLSENEAANSIEKLTSLHRQWLKSRGRTP